MKYSLLDVLKESLPELRNKRLKPVTVAVLDSGVDSSHEDLRNRVCGAWEFVEENNTVVKRTLPLKNNNDDAGHGTAVASIIAKIAPNTEILDFKVLNANFSGSVKMMLAGLQAAIDSDAKIINMSLACLAKYRDEITVLLEQAYQKHKIVIAAKRNIPKVNDLGFPAELSSCISVDNHPCENNPFFIEYIDEQPIEFAAAGENILVAESGGGYYRTTGTSFATPTVSANAALLLGAYPDLELYEIKSVLKYHFQRKSFAGKSVLNPLEIAEHPRTANISKLSECICPDCKKIFYVHDAFSLVKCPNCHTVFSTFPELNRNLCSEVTRQLTYYVPRECVYHNVRHTRFVIANANLFTHHYSSISAGEKKCLMTAALLHDYGYKVQYENNEPIAVQYAAEILPEYGYRDNEISLIQSLIAATAMQIAPKTLLEKILCDADVAHVGTNLYEEKSNLLRQELKNQGHEFSDEQWLRHEIAFLSHHKFRQPWLEVERKAAKAAVIRKYKACLKK